MFDPATGNHQRAEFQMKYIPVQLSILRQRYFPV